MMNQLQLNAAAAQRAYAAAPTEHTRAAMVDAQRAFDCARHADRERAARAHRRAAADELAARIESRLAQPDEGGCGELGWITRARAEWLGMFPSIFGGWVATQTHASTSLAAMADRRYLACGEAALGRDCLPADREEVRAALRDELEGWLRPANRPYILSVGEDTIEEILRILDMVERP